MSLNADEIEKLEHFGFKVFPHPQWSEKYRQHRLLFLQSTQSEKQFDSEAGTQAVAQQGIIGYECYPTVEETYQQASALATANPQLASWIDIGDSWEKSINNGGYDLMVLKITNSAIGGDKPKLFIHSAMHAREYTTAALTLEFATQLLNQYAVNADVTWIVDWHEVHILFHMNPDGRKIAEQGVYWRKNTNTDYCASGEGIGADLNRNFTHFWNRTDGQGASSGVQCSSVYRGPFAASEPETQAVENYVRSQFVDNRGSGDNDAASLDTTGIHLDIHSAGGLVLWPYGHTNTPAPNETGLQTLGRKIAFWNGYSPIQANGLSPTDGTSRNVSYGELGVPAYTFELGTAFFQDCSTYENTIKPDNLPALVYAAKVVREPYRLPSGPEVHSLTVNGQENITVTQGDSVILSAFADDGRYQNSDGIEPQQTVVQAEYFMDSPPWEGTAAGNPMNPADDSFNSSAETIDAVIDTTGLSLGKHAVYVRAMDANGQWGAISSGFITVSEPGPGLQIPSAPSNLQALATGSDSISASWIDTADNEDSFTVQRSLDGSTWSTIATLVANQATYDGTGLQATYDDTALIAETTYYYRVNATNSAGASAYSNVSSDTTEPLSTSIDDVASGESPQTGSVSGTYVATQIDDGTTEVITEQGSKGRKHSKTQSYTHTWIFNVTGGTGGVLLTANAWVSGNEGANFYYSDDGGSSWNLMFTVDGNSTSTLNTFALPAATNGEVRVQARDAAQTGGEPVDQLIVDYLVITTDTIPASPPAAPSNMTVTGVTSSAVSLLFTDNAGNELGFNIWRSETDPSGACSGGSNINILGSSSGTGLGVTGSDTTVAPSSTYWYWATAFIAGGDSACSNAVQATTDAALSTITANAYKIKRSKYTVDLTWSGISTTLADIYRNSVLIQTENDGAYTDKIDTKGGKTYVYKVCEQGSTTACSSTVNVVF